LPPPRLSSFDELFSKLPVVAGADGADLYALVIAFHLSWMIESICVLHTTHKECEKDSVLKHNTDELDSNKKDLPIVVADGADIYALAVAFYPSWMIESICITHST
jgi:hypothetical protein